MKSKKSRYLFRRCFWLAVAMLAWSLLLIVLMALNVWRTGREGWVLIVSLAVLAAAIIFAYRYIYKPYREGEKILKLFAAGYTIEGVFDLRYPYSLGSEKAFERVKQVLETKELINASRKQAELLALQNQINPHFLYNTLEGIRGEALVEGLDTVAEMTEALASFFRYTISKVEKLVTLEDELNNIETYFSIQRYRFGERMKLEIVYDELDRAMLMQCRMPKLTLQPIVENAIIHGIERKIGQGSIKISLEMTETRLMIMVADDGVGMSKEVLERLNQKLNALSLEYMSVDDNKGGGIALLNVNNRIRLLFGEEYGLVAYSTPDVGTDIEICLPRLMDGTMEQS